MKAANLLAKNRTRRASAARQKKGALRGWDARPKAELSARRGGARHEQHYPAAARGGRLGIDPGRLRVTVRRGNRTRRGPTTQPRE